MRKFFLIPLLTLVCSVMAFATVRTAGTIEELRSAITDAEDGDEIQLTADINYGKVGYASNLNITKSITLNGKGHTLTGAGQRQSGNSTYATVWVNLNGTNDVDVVFKDINIINDQQLWYNDMAIQTRGNLHSLTLQNVYLESYSVPLQIGGTHAYQTYTTQVTIEDSHLKAKDYYPILSWNKYNLVANNTTFEGWCSLYFKGVSSSTGSRGSVIVANNCQFNAPNVHSGESNAFGMFVCEDDGISITLNNCSMDAVQLGDQSQAIMVLSEWAAKDRRTQPVSLTINGDNTYINGRLLTNNWANGFASDGTFTAPIPDPFPLSVTISGGTYAFNPAEEGWLTNNEAPDLENFSNIDFVTIPDGYEVKEITTQQGDQTTTLYRVRKTITTSYSINQDVEGEGDGLNENTEFVISGSTTDQALTVDSVVAHYVEVSDNATLTIPEGKTLEVTNGLDVTEGAQVVVEAGSTLKVGEGGVTSQTVESIVIEANENGAASFLLNPEVIVNTTPNLTVRMTAKQIGRNADNDYFWHRFAMPVAGISSWDKEGGLGDGNENYPTYLYAWDYTNNAWENIAPNAMEPLKGYTLTLASEYIDGSAPDGHLNVLQDVTYIFKGNLVGNTDQPLNFQREGFNFFGNSYTGYMHVKTMLQGLADEHIDGTAYMWNADEQSYQGVSLTKLIKGRGLEEWQKEVAPMQTFILRLRGADSADEGVNYAATIWGNPRYGNTSAAPAPRRAVATVNEETYMEIAVKAANGKSSSVDFTEAVDNSDAFESGYDVEKYMNEKTINLYATVNGMNLSSVVTDNIEGKTLSLKTNDEIAYTMSFKNVEGVEYAIRDNATNRVIKIEEGATYDFAAQPNSTIEGRFEIVGVHKVTTAIENADVKTNAKGIYTIMGQYLGENFDILPAGVYVVGGVKIVK